MDSDLMWAALGTMVSALGVGIAWRQLRLQASEMSNRPGVSPRDVSGVSVRPPTGRLPPTVRGRDRLVNELLRVLRRPAGEFVVLTGVGGVGKSTVATALAARARAMRIGMWRRVDVWWVSAADPSSLTSAMVTVARQLDAPDADLEAIAADRTDAPDRLWALLERTRRRWLLILDNADDPEVLARPTQPTGHSGLAGMVGDGTGWLRPSRRGLVVVTSRDTSSGPWGRHAHVINLEPLDEHAAALVLLDWAPDAGTEGEALRLASRLGRLPLALGLAGSYLDSDVAFKPTFPEYLCSLASDPATSRLLTDDRSADADPRSSVMHTWELSLDALTHRGVPQARALLRLLSCFAASTPIPIDLLDSQRLVPLLAGSGTATPATAERDLEAGLRHLRRLRLIDAPSPTSQGEQVLAIHPVIADTNRAHLASNTASRLVDPTLVRNTAVDLIAQDLAELDYDEPADWPRYRLLVPHMHALLETVAPHLDHEHLGALVSASAWAAAAHDRAGAMAAAERLSRATLVALPALDDDDPACLHVRHIFAWETARQGRPAEAEAMWRDVLARRTRVLGPDHADTLTTSHELAWVTAGQGRHAEAEAMYRDVLERRGHGLGEEHPDTLLTRHELAWAIASQGRGREAETILHSVIAIRARILRPDHPRTLQSHHELAWAIAVQGRWDEAEDAYNDVLTNRRRILGVEHPETLTTAHELAWTIAMQGRHREATVGYQTVLAARARVLGPDHPDTLTTIQALNRLRYGKTTPAHHVT